MALHTCANAPTFPMVSLDSEGLLPEWAALIFGMPAILFAYAYVVWQKGFGPEDRVLFRRNVGA